MSRRRKLLKIVLFGTMIWIAALVTLPAVFGESPHFSTFALVGWIFLAACALTYMYYFLFTKDD